MKQQTTLYFKRSRLIFESGAQENTDYVIGAAPAPLAYNGYMQRDGLAGRSDLHEWINKWDETIKMKLCDFV